MRTPILFLIYRRPELTVKVLAAIRQARPEILLVSADAPHPDKPEERQLCEGTKNCVIKGIDWPCRVETRFPENHLGCKRAVSQALEWAFLTHERLIILEDDCVPDASFFPWCEELLERYAEEPRIMQICGSNLAGVRPEPGMSGYFSRFGSVWGWATWRRAWKLFDVELKSWPELRISGELKTYCLEPYEAEWRKEIYNSVHSGGLDSWAYPWAYARMLHDKVAVIPAVNLVQNIGFGEGSTHSIAASSSRLSIPAGSLQFPIVMPETITAWREADQAYLKNVVRLPSTLRGKIKYRVRKILRCLVGK